MITEACFVLPRDVVTIPLRDVPLATRRHIGGEDDDVAVIRPGLRTPTRVVDAGTAALLGEFRSPSRIVDAIVRFSRAHDLDPATTLDEAFDALCTFANAGLLVSAESDATQPITASFGAGASIAGYEIRRAVQILEDTELYEARDGAGRAVAVKIARPNPSDLTRHMLDHEASVLRRLDGLACPRVVARGTFDRRPFLATEWCPGVPITNRARELRQLAAPGRDRRLLRLCAAVLDAYDLMHRRGVVHGDVHPGNVLVDRRGVVTIIDFGRASLVAGEECSSPAPRAAVPFFYEPELAGALLNGEWPPAAGPAGEQHALAALLYLLITGQYYLDFSPEHPVICEQILSDEPVPFVRRGCDPWPSMEAVLRRALARAPADRYPDVGAFRDDLRCCTPRASGTVTRGPVVDIARGERVVADVLDDVKLGGARFFQGLTEAPTSSVGFGAAGIAWFLYRVSLVRGDPGLLALADAWATRIDTADVDGRGFWNGNLGLSREIVGVVAPLHTASGVHCVRALIAHARGDPGTHRRDIRAFLEAVSQPCAGLDLSFGRAGVLVASSLLLDTVADTNGQGGAELLDFTRRMVAEVMAHLESLPTIGREGVVRYLGMAHGWAGMLYAVMRACRSSGAVLPSSLPARLDQLAAHAVSTGREVVWPIVPMPADGGGVSPLFTAGWCRGNAGYVHLWCLAHDTFREPLYLDLAERSALRVWRHEGTDASLCCGLAGRALGLVRLYQHTGDPVWLRRARRLAAKAAKIDHTGSPRRVSLFQGQLGVALAIAELDDPNGATMPLFGAEGWRGSVVG